MCFFQHASNHQVRSSGASIELYLFSGGWGNAKILENECGKITRLPIVDSNGAVLYIVHQSGLFKFIAEQALAGKAADIEKLTLQDLVDDAELKNWVANIAFVPEQASVAEAKNKMEQQPGCQDLIVTKTGSKTEPMLGWMTNVDIGRRAIIASQS